MCIADVEGDIGVGMGMGIGERCVYIVDFGFGFGIKFEFGFWGEVGIEGTRTHERGTRTAASSIHHTSHNLAIMIKPPRNRHPPQRHIRNSTKHSRRNINILQRTPLTLIHDLRIDPLPIRRVRDPHTERDMALPGEPDARLAVREAVAADYDGAVGGGEDGCVAALRV